MSGDCGHGWGYHRGGSSSPCSKCEEEKVFTKLIDDLKKDAARWQYLQNMPLLQAQALFWNNSSRRDRNRIIDGFIAAQQPKETL